MLGTEVLNFPGIRVLNLLGTKVLDGAYNKSPQPLGSRNPMLKTDEALRQNVGIILCANPSLEEVRNYLVVPVVKNNVGHVSVMFHVNNFHISEAISNVEPTETDLQ